MTYLRTVALFVVSMGILTAVGPPKTATESTRTTTSSSQLNALIQHISTEAQQQRHTLWQAFGAEWNILTDNALHDIQFTLASNRRGPHFSALAAQLQAREYVGDLWSLLHRMHRSNGRIANIFADRLNRLLVVDEDLSQSERMCVHALEMAQTWWRFDRRIEAMIYEMDLNVSKMRCSDYLVDSSAEIAENDKLSKLILIFRDMAAKSIAALHSDFKSTTDVWNGQCVQMCNHLMKYVQ